MTVVRRVPVLAPHSSEPDVSESSKDLSCVWIGCKPAVVRIFPKFSDSFQVAEKLLESKCQVEVN